LPSQPDRVGGSAEVLGVDRKAALLFFNEALAVRLRLRMVIRVVGEAVIEDDVAIVFARVLCACRNQDAYCDDDADR